MIKDQNSKIKMTIKRSNKLYFKLSHLNELYNISLPHKRRNGTRFLQSHDPNQILSIDPSSCTLHVF